MNKHGKRLITLAALATTTTAIIHIANKVVAASAGLKEMLDTNGKNYYHWRFGDIYYTRKGKGSPILLIHDMLPGGSGYEWSRIEDDLALEHTVYNIDLPGCGRSEKPGMTYTNYVYVQSICDFIKNVIGEKTWKFRYLVLWFTIWLCPEPRSITSLLRTLPLIHSTRFAIFRTLIMRLPTKADVMQRMYMQTKYQNT